jgi:hypothetical protein
MYVSFQITNRDIFHTKIIDLDTSGLTSRGNDSRNNHLGFYGSLEIEEENGSGWRTITGEFGTKDYAKEFAFILK